MPSVTLFVYILTFDTCRREGRDRVDVYEFSTQRWSSLPSMPSKRLGHAMAITPDGSKLICTGGSDGSSYLDTVIEYELPDGFSLIVPRIMIPATTLPPTPLGLMSITEEADAYDKWAHNVQVQVDAAGAAVQANQVAIKTAVAARIASATQEKQDAKQKIEQTHRQNVADEERRHREEMAKKEQIYQQQLESIDMQCAKDISIVEARQTRLLANLPAIGNFKDQIRKARDRAEAFHNLSKSSAAASGGGGAAASSTSSRKRNRSPEPEVCVVCWVNPKDSTMVHTNTNEGHGSCCFKCATALKEEGKPCPICREKIDMVIKQFNN